MENGPQLNELNYINPEYKTDQRRVLDAIEVKPLSEIPESNFQKIIEENRNFYGTKVFIPYPDYPENKIFYKRGRNNIALIQNLYFRGGTPLAANINIVDLESNMAFSVSNLTTINGDEKKMGVANIYYDNNLFGKSKFNPTESGGMVVWHDNETERKFLNLKLGSGVGDFRSFLELFHECGHRFQFKNTNELLRPEWRIIVENIFKENGGKQYVSEIERNAWDFSLAVVEKLKNLGVDLTRGLDQKQMMSGVKAALLTYELPLRLVPDRKNNSIIE